MLHRTYLIFRSIPAAYNGINTYTRLNRDDYDHRCVFGGFLRRPEYNGRWVAPDGAAVIAAPILPPCVRLPKIVTAARYRMAIGSSRYKMHPEVAPLEKRARWPIP